MGHGGVRGVRGAYQGERGGHGGDQAAGGGADGVVGEVEAQRVGRRGGDHGGAQPVDGAWLWAGSAATAAVAAASSSGGAVKRMPGVKPAGPQPVGDLLVAVRGGQGGGVDAAEEVAVVLDERDARTDRGAARRLAVLPGGGGGGGDGGGVRAAVAARQHGDLAGVEQAAAATGRLAAAQQAAADVGVDGLGLHAQPLGGLARGQLVPRLLGHLLLVLPY